MRPDVCPLCKQRTNLAQKTDGRSIVLDPAPQLWEERVAGISKGFTVEFDRPGVPLYIEHRCKPKRIRGQ